MPMDEARGRHAQSPFLLYTKAVAEWIIIDLLWICCIYEPAHLLSPSATGVPWSSTATVTRADDMYTAAADTEEEDIDHFLPPLPTTSV